MVSDLLWVWLREPGFIECVRSVRDDCAIGMPWICFYIFSYTIHNDTRHPLVTYGVRLRTTGSRTHPTSWTLFEI